MNYKIGTRDNTVWLFREMKDYYTSEMFTTYYEPLSEKEMLEEWPKVQAAVTESLKRL